MRKISSIIFLLLAFLWANTAHAYSIPPACASDGTHALTYDATNNKYLCTAVTGSGGAVSITPFNAGIILSPNPLTGTGTIGLAAPAAATLGGVMSLTAVTHQFLTSIGTSGLPTQAQPAFTDISGTVAAAQLPNPTSSALGGVMSLTAVTHQFLTSIGTTGLPTQAQPATGDISGAGTAITANTGTSGATLGFLNGNNTHSGTNLFTGGIPTLANGNAAVAASITAGGIYIGQGSTSDLTFENKSSATVCSVATGTTTLNCTGLQVGGVAVITGNQTITLTGPITGSGTTSIATTIGAAQVTNANLVNASTTVEGQTCTLGSTCITAAQATAFLNLFTTSLQGAVPASGGGTTNFLRADGTWAAPAGGGNVSAGGTLTANQIVLGAGTTAVAALGSLGTTTTVLHGNAAGAPSFGAVALATDVSGNLPNANLASQTANTVLGALTATTPSGLALPSCVDTSGNHLNYTSGTGFSCGNTSSGGGSTSIGTSLTAASPSISGHTNSGLFTPDGTNTTAVTANGVEVEQWNTLASGIDYLSVTAGTSTAPPSIAVAGTTTNQGLNLTPAGAGAVNLTNANTGLQINSVNALRFPTSDSGPASSSIAIGSSALVGQTSSAAYSNTALGYQSMSGTMTTAGLNNTSVGFQAGKVITSGSGDTFVGEQAGVNATTVTNTVAIGMHAGQGIGSGASNVFIGLNAGGSSSGSNTQNNNLGLGTNALQLMTAASGNVAFGDNALGNVTSGGNNIGIGRNAGWDKPTTGSGNILICASGTQGACATPIGSSSNFISIGNVIFASGASGTVNSPAGQVAIGTSAPNTGVALDLGSNTTTANSSLLLPIGTTGARPTTGINGMTRYNSTTNFIEGYINNAWQNEIQTTSQTVPAATLTTAVSQGAASYYIPFSNATTRAVGDIVTGTSISNNTTITQISTSTATATTTANGGGSGNNLTLTSGTGVNAPMLITDTTSAGRIAAGCAIVSKPSATVVVANCSLASVLNGDTILMYPAIQINQITSGTVASGATISFTANTTNLSVTNLNSQGAITVGNGIIQGVQTILNSPRADNAGDSSNVPLGYAADLLIGRGAGAALNQIGGNTLIGSGAGAALACVTGVYQANSFGTIGNCTHNVAIGEGAMSQANAPSAPSPVGGIGYGGQNTAIGAYSLLTNTNGNANIAIGDHVLIFNTTGNGNIFIGADSGQNVATGSFNTVIGVLGGSGAGVLGSNNTCIGNAASTASASGVCGTINGGNSNIVIGVGAADTTLTSGSNNLLIGNNADTPAGSTSNYGGIFIGSTTPVWSTTGGGTPSTAAQTFAGTITLTNIASDAGVTDDTVCARTSDNRLFKGSGTLGICLGTSSARFKKDIQPIVYGLAEIESLKPVNFHFNDEKYGDIKKLQFGFIAEDAVKVVPKLVGLDKDYKPNTVDYMGMVPILVKGMQEQQAEIEQLEAQVVAMGGKPLVKAANDNWWDKFMKAIHP